MSFAKFYEKNWYQQFQYLKAEILWEKLISAISISKGCAYCLIFFNNVGLNIVNSLVTNEFAQATTKTSFWVIPYIFETSSNFFPTILGQNLKSVVDYLMPLAKEIKIFNTICASTSLRQNEAKDLAKESDLMIVVGSKKSANTTHLAEILKGITATIHIETEDELDNYKDLIEKSMNISVTAGASTPDAIIENVMKKLNQY